MIKHGKLGLDNQIRYTSNPTLLMIDKKLNKLSVDLITHLF